MVDSISIDTVIDQLSELSCYKHAYGKYYCDWNGVPTPYIRSDFGCELYLYRKWFGGRPVAVQMAAETAYFVTMSPFDYTRNLPKTATCLINS